MVPEGARCGRIRDDGVSCVNIKMPGTDICWLHASWPMRNFQRKRLAKIELVRITELAGKLSTSPAVAMLEMVQEAAANVEFYGQQVAALRARVDEMGDDPGTPVLIDLEGVQRVHPAFVGAGVAGRVDPENWKAEPHVLVRMYNDERDRLMKYCKLCLDAGVAERLVKLAEQQGRAMVKILDGVFDRLELTPTQAAQLPAIMSEILGHPAPALDVVEPEAP